MDLKHSKGNWSLGKTGGCVITDSTEGFEDTTGHLSIEYYGGTLIAESIYKNADAKVIAAAPDLLKSEIENLEFLEWIESQKFNMWSDKMQLMYERIASTKAAIKKATE